MERTGWHDEVSAGTARRRLRQAVRHARSRLGVKGAMSILIAGMAATGCTTGPEVKTVVRETFSIEAIDSTSRQTIGNVTVEDLGETRGVVTSVQVQACDGPLPVGREVERRTTKGEKYIETIPVYETVDPFNGLYVRKLKITNSTKHNIRLNHVDAVLVDAAGNDNELMTRSALRHDLRARRPCRSTEALIDNLRSVKLLGADIRIRPGRATVLLAAFTGVDESILGDWTLELHEVPVEMGPAGEVLHAASFEFPLLAKGYRTTTRLRRERWFDSWKEIHRTTEEIGPGR